MHLSFRAFRYRHEGVHSANATAFSDLLSAQECQGAMMAGIKAAHRPELCIAFIYHLQEPMSAREKPCHAQEEHIVARETLNGSIALHHDHLGCHRYCLNVNTEGPEHPVDPCMPSPRV